MSNRLYRMWMFWLVIALQAMTPFIHAHAGTAQLNHAGWMHIHSPLGSDAACQAASHADHEAEVGVAQGMPLRHAALTAAEDARAGVTPVTQPAAVGVGAVGLPFPAFPAWLPPPPDHAMPLALAPPRC